MIDLFKILKKNKDNDAFSDFVEVFKIQLQAFKELERQGKNSLLNKSVDQMRYLDKENYNLYNYQLKPFKQNSPLSVSDALRSTGMYELFNEFRNYRTEASRLKCSLPLYLGSIGGIPKVIDFKHITSLLVSGRTGSGKTTFLYQLMLSLILANHPETCKIVCIANGKQDLKVFDKLVDLYGVSGTKPAIDALRRLETLRVQREAFFTKNNVKDAMHANEVAYKDRIEGLVTPYIVVFIDELFNDKNYVNEEWELFSGLIHKGRSAGIRIVFSTQHPSIENMKQGRYQAHNGCAFGQTHEIAARIAAGSTTEANTSKIIQDIETAILKLENKTVTKDDIAKLMELFKELKTLSKVNALLNLKVGEYCYIVNNEIESTIKVADLSSYDNVKQIVNNIAYIYSFRYNL
jgi:hypothetical protein